MSFEEIHTEEVKSNNVYNLLSMFLKIVSVYKHIHRKKQYYKISNMVNPRESNIGIRRCLLYNSYNFYSSLNLKNNVRADTKGGEMVKMDNHSVLTKLTY